MRSAVASSMVRIERAGAPPYLGSAAVQYLNRSRASIVLDLKDADIHNILRLLADVGRVNIVTADDVAETITGSRVKSANGGFAAPIC